jgi:dihydrofolate synthase / folylpolyglutamate synthase
MNYKETLEFLYSQLPAYHRIGKAAYKNDLYKTIALDAYFEHPHQKFRSIHVAGTNGKGSLSHMTASVLQEAGYKTGLYTSPHLKDFRERITINGEMISESEIISFVKSHKDIIKSLLPSFFEMTVAMAFDYFARNMVDIAVIEVGLGGRLDSTNIINPILSVITNIGHDHMDLLGNTLIMIAREKAGIIKKSVPVIISETLSETINVFVSKATENESKIFFADKNFSCKLEDSDILKGEREYVITDNLTNSSITGFIPLGGDYQSKNLQALFQVFKTLDGVFKVSEKNVIDGVRKVVINTGLMGRWQILRHNPLTICDTGHNKEGFEYIMNQITKIPKSVLHMVIGFVNDKDLSLVFPLFPRDAIYYFTNASVPRALDAHILMEKASLYGLEGNCFADVKSAVKAATEKASETDMIFIGGSTFIVADAL